LTYPTFNFNNLVANGRLILERISSSSVIIKTVNIGGYTETVAQINGAGGSNVTLTAEDFFLG
jgi:hypothetical protein